MLFFSFPQILIVITFARTRRYRDAASSLFLCRRNAVPTAQEIFTRDFNALRWSLQLDYTFLCTYVNAHRMSILSFSIYIYNLHNTYIKYIMYLYAQVNRPDPLLCLSACFILKCNTLPNKKKICARCRRILRVIITVWVCVCRVFFGSHEHYWLLVFVCVFLLSV